MAPFTPEQEARLAEVVRQAVAAAMVEATAKAEAMRRVALVISKGERIDLSARRRA